MLLSVVYGT